MGTVSKAEAQRRAREWLRIDFEDADRTAAFEAAKHALSSDDPADIFAAIAVGELGWAHALLPRIETPRVFLQAFGAYFMASADDAFARASWPRIVAMVQSEPDNVDADTLRSLVAAAEAVGDRATAGDLAERARHAARANVHGEDVITSMVYGTLGYAPDAPKGRLLLRPDIDPEWNRLQVENIHMGDALVAVNYTRSDDGMQFEIIQIAGAYPIRLIFEPILSIRVERAFVDGTPASLDFRPHGDRVIIPVQILLDDRRVLRFE
jgi:hypothetical protein